QSQQQLHNRFTSRLINNIQQQSLRHGILV
ncbi:unnamed protein product, partial [Rotaria sp. Silwood2]